MRSVLAASLRLACEAVSPLVAPAPFLTTPTQLRADGADGADGADKAVEFLASTAWTTSTSPTSVAVGAPDC